MWHSASFFQRIILVLIAAACTAGLVEFYKTMIQGADDALNGAYRSHPSSSVPANPGTH